MKTLTTILLTIFLCISVKGQNNPDFRGTYFSFYVGAGPALDDGAILFGYSLNGGYQWNKFVGVGGSWTGHLSMEYFFAGFNGLSAQYRIKPSEKWSVALDYGYVLTHSHGNDVVYWEYIPDWYPFFKFHIGWKPKEKFTLGLSFTGLPLVNYEECNNYDAPPDNCEPVYIHKYEWIPSGVMLTFGFSLN